MDSSHPHAFISPQQELLFYKVEVNVAGFNGEILDLCGAEKWIGLWFFIAF